MESASGRFRRLVGSNGLSILSLGDDARAPAKVGSRDGKVARDPDLCIGMSAGMTGNATMVEELTNSTLDERHLHCRRLLGRQTRSFRQAVVMKKIDVETSNRGCGRAGWTHSPRPVSGDMRVGRVRIQ